MAVGFQDGLGHIAEEVVITVAVRHVGEFRRHPRDERILLIRHPKPHRRAQGLGPLFGGIQEQLPTLELAHRPDSGGFPTKVGRSSWMPPLAIWIRRRTSSSVAEINGSA